MTPSPKILIIEDEILIADYLKELLLEEDFTEVEMANDKEEAIAQMEAFSPDIILMDINIHGVNSGIDLARSMSDYASVIYITGQNDPSLMNQAFETAPEAYLTKPIKKNDLIAAIRLIAHKQQNKYITVKDGYNMVKINLKSVLFVKSENNYIDIQLSNKKYSIRQSLEHFIQEIQSEKFLRVHRSYIVNVEKIKAKKTNTLMVEHFEIPFSRNIDLSL